MAPSVKRPTLDFSSGHDLMGREMEPHTGLCADNTEHAWDSLTPTPPPPPQQGRPPDHLCPSPILSLSKINKQVKS